MEQISDAPVKWPPLIELCRTVSFFASVVKSGEPWTDACQAQYDIANEASKALWEETKAALTVARIEGERAGMERAYAIAKLEEGAGGDFKELLAALEKIVMDNRAIAKELPHDHD